MNQVTDLNVKDAVHSMLQSWPDTVTWDEVQYHLYVRQQIEAGLADHAAGRLIDSEELRRRFEAMKNQAGNP
jgi:predicted transcriptional regulator